MNPQKPSIEIVYNVEGQPNKLMVDGIDCSHAQYLLIEFTPNKTGYIIGTMPPKEKQVEDEHP